MNLNFDFGSVKKSPALDEQILYDVLVIGTGPAGLNAALYAKRKGLSVGMFTSKMGGQVVDTSIVENYLGIQQVTGEQLVEQFVAHVNALKIPILKDAEVLKIKKDEDGLFKIQASGFKIYRSKTVIMATGSKPRKLGVKGEDAYLGRGVAYCAICDGPLFEDRNVIVAGGGNSAIEAAIDLSKVARKVTVVHRSQLRADQIIVDKLKNIENLEIILETKIVEIKGEQLVNGITAEDKSGNTIEIPIDGVFVEIGYLPNNELAKGLVDLNDHGEVKVNLRGETSLPGLFAAGDVTDVPYKQIVISAGDGAKAALSANDYINKMK
ncbi:MAG: NADH-dependent peroxiredoxin subunit [Clostridiales bacterium]|jgi:alkyl hydroperoxide reductase subunit F|nr:NADH-dependent peroxiredoxin subunit [Clostridiales bacterium]MDN5298028.1 NADH-dependent peroxiredoxin subunit [Clostridiales bacterium]